MQISEKNILLGSKILHPPCYLEKDYKIHVLLNNLSNSISQKSIAVIIINDLPQ